MDTGNGRFEQFDAADIAELEAKMTGLRAKYPKSKGVFQVGEHLEIKGSMFEIRDISPFGMKLKLLKQP